MVCGFFFFYFYEKNKGEKYKGKIDIHQINAENRFPDCNDTNLLEEYRKWNWARYMEECPFRPYVKELFLKLKSMGIRIHIVTARFSGDGYSEEMIEQITKERFEKEGIPVDEFHIGLSEKDSICKGNGIELLVEDSPEQAIKVSDKLLVFIVDNPYNVNCMGRNIWRIYDFNPDTFIDKIKYAINHLDSWDTEYEFENSKDVINNSPDDLFMEEKSNKLSIKQRMNLSKFKKEFKYDSVNKTLMVNGELYKADLENIESGKIIKILPFKIAKECQRRTSVSIQFPNGIRGEAVVVFDSNFFNLSKNSRAAVLQHEIGHVNLHIGKNTKILNMISKYRHPIERFSLKLSTLRYQDDVHGDPFKELEADRYSANKTSDKDMIKALQEMQKNSHKKLQKILNKKYLYDEIVRLITEEMCSEEKKKGNIPDKRKIELEIKKDPEIQKRIEESIVLNFKLVHEEIDRVDADVRARIRALNDKKMKNAKAYKEDKEIIDNSDIFEESHSKSAHDDEIKRLLSEMSDGLRLYKTHVHEIISFCRRKKYNEARLSFNKNYGGSNIRAAYEKICDNMYFSALGRASTILLRTIYCAKQLGNYFNIERDFDKYISSVKELNQVIKKYSSLGDGYDSSKSTQLREIDDILMNIVNDICTHFLDEVFNAIPDERKEDKENKKYLKESVESKNGSFSVDISRNGFITFNKENFKKRNIIFVIPHRKKTEGSDNFSESLVSRLSKNTVLVRLSLLSTNIETVDIKDDDELLITCMKRNNPKNVNLLQEENTDTYMVKCKIMEEVLKYAKKNKNKTFVIDGNAILMLSRDITNAYKDYPIIVTGTNENDKTMVLQNQYRKGYTPWIMMEDLTEVATQMRKWKIIAGTAKKDLPTYINRQTTTADGVDMVTLLPGEAPYRPELLNTILSMNTYILGDCHLSTKDPEKTKMITNSINSTVSPQDHIVFLGDLDGKKGTGSYELTRDFLKRLRTKNIYLILGNNDPYTIDEYVKLGFKSVVDKAVYKISAMQQVILTHCAYPVKSGEINIHGHIHGSRCYWNVDWKNHFDVWNEDFIPITIRQCLDILKRGDYVARTEIHKIY